MLVLVLPLFAIGSALHTGCAAVPVGRTNYYGAPGSKMTASDVDIDIDDAVEP